MLRHISHLRFAPAVVCALLSLAFVVLWVRSYYREGVTYIPVSDHRRIDVGSFPGLLIFRTSYSNFPVYASRDWFWESHPTAAPPGLRPSGFSLQRTLAGYRIAVPYWFLAALSFGLTALLAYKPVRRFTVRGLLITTTLLAAVLGLAVYAV